MIGRNHEIQDIASRLARDLGEHLTDQATIEEMQNLAESYGKEDAQKAVSDPELKPILEKAANDGSKKEADTAIISKYFNLHRDLVRAFSSGLNDPLRNLAEQRYLKGFYSGVESYAARGSDIVSSARRMSELNIKIQESAGIVSEAKRRLKDDFTKTLGEIVCASSDMQAVFAKIDAGDVVGLKEDFPKLSDRISCVEAVIRLEAIKRSILRNASLSDFLSVTAKTRRDKQIADWEMYPETETEKLVNRRRLKDPGDQEGQSRLEPETLVREIPDEEISGGKHPQYAKPHSSPPEALIPETAKEKEMSREELKESRDRHREDTSWIGTGKKTYYQTQEGETVSGEEIVRKARSFVARAFNAELDKIIPKAQKLLESTVENLSKALTASVDMSPETKAKVERKPVTRLDLAELDEAFADRTNEISASSAKKSDIDRAESIVEGLVNAQDGVLYSFAQQEARNIAGKDEAYQNWAKSISSEINRSQGGQSYHKQAAKEDNSRAEKSFRRFVNELNWSPLAKLVLDEMGSRDQKQLPPPETREVDISENWADLSKKYYAEYNDAKALVSEINKKSNELFKKMEDAKSKWKTGEGPRKEYYAARLEFNKMMEELVAAVSEMDKYESDTLTFPPPPGTPTSATHSVGGTRGNPLFYFINTMFGADIKNLDEAQKYVEILSNGRTVVRYEVLKKEFMDFFVSKLAILIYEALHDAFRGEADAMIRLLYADEILIGVEEESSAEELKKEIKEIEHKQYLEERRKINQSKHEEETPEKRRLYDLYHGTAPDDIDVKKLHEGTPDEDPLYTERSYGDSYNFPARRPTEEEE